MGEAISEAVEGKESREVKAISAAVEGKEPREGEGEAAADEGKAEKRIQQNERRMAKYRENPEKVKRTQRLCMATDDPERV